MNTMYRLRSLLILTIIICISFATATASFAVTYTGSLSSELGEIIGSGDWINPGPTTIYWTISQDDTGLWHYEYQLSVYDRDISHFILETSATFTNANLLSPIGPFNEIEIKTHTPGSGSPNLPGNIYGIKFDDATGTTGIFAFDSWRCPVWGDFYIKGGAAKNEDVDINKQQEFNTAYNSGFSAVDPIDDAANGSLNGHLLVPDTKTVVPEPSSIAVLLTGLMPIVGYTLKRRK